MLATELGLRIKTRKTETKPIKKDSDNKGSKLRIKSFIQGVVDNIINSIRLKELRFNDISLDQLKFMLLHLIG
ncbi:MAG: hypothetical protein WA395_02965 [Nitrososphaeraceae archaeon]